MASPIDVGPVDLAASLRGGQAFGWRPLPSGGFGRVCEGRFWDLREARGRVIAHATPHATATETARFARDYFRADDGYEAQLVRLSGEPALARAIDEHRGLRLLRQDPWETLVSFITSANNNVIRIEGILERLARRAGTLVQSGVVGDVPAFPTPAEVARLGEPGLRAIGAGYRAPYLFAAASRVADGFDLARLRTLGFPEARTAILDFAGVGPKVADCILAFSLDHTEAFPIDRHVERAVRSAGLRAPKARSKMGTWASRRWGPDAALAQQFLFHARRVAPRRRDGPRRGGRPNPEVAGPRASPHGVRVG
ncbi:MAG: DNA glycosylase [Thermoplasmatota archaeon]